MFFENNPQVVKLLGGKRCKPGPNQGVVQLVMGRAPVGGDAALPKYPAAHIQMDLGIVPGAQESTAISNWFQDGIIAAMNGAYAHPEENIDAKNIGVSYHSKLLRGRFVYMVHAKNAVLQEMVASTLNGHEITMVPRRIYKAAKEMADMETGLKAVKDAMATAVRAKLSRDE
jgi:hypothetical protein